jgi:hypothetical protein
MFDGWRWSRNLPAMLAAGVALMCGRISVGKKKAAG